ncbi:MAG: LysM peptidoglycan-binding domain-containing protein [Gammaproteobacteria bacterium]
MPVEPVTVRQERRESTPAEAQPRSYTDAWHRIRENLALDRHVHRHSVKARLNWYARHQEYLDRVAERATPYLYYIMEQLEERGLPMEMALLPIVESAYQPFAYSPSHASGIWQFIPGTGRMYGLKQNWWYDGRRDIVAGTRAALDYLEKLHDEFEGNWLHALAAYNTGERNVARAIARNRRAGKDTDFWSLRLPRETRGYVPSLLAVAELIADPARYDIELKPVPNERYFAKVDVGGQLDLALAAEFSGLSMDELYTLNPGFNRWATDPDGPHYLLVPVERERQFREQLAQLDEQQRVNWQRHVIQRGETLSQIAQRYHTSIATIRESNGLRSNFIRTGHSLLIPSAKMPPKHYSLSLDSRRFRGLKRLDGDGEKYLYTVRRGDTLWDIGRQYGVSISELCRWNGISPQRFLKPGQKLTLWISREQPDKQVAQAKHSIDESGVISYTVQRGDSLWLISRRFGVTISQLLEWNNLPRNKHLQPGQELILKDAPALASGA